MNSTTPDSTYAKPFFTVPEQIRQLRGRGMDCGDDVYAADVLERYGYYRLSGYWHPYRDRPTPPAPAFDQKGREIRLETFVSETSLDRVVTLYEFDHELRMRLGGILSTIETAFRFFIAHRLGRVDVFAHRNPRALDVANRKTKYRKWLENYDRDEKQAQGAFVTHFREHYGPHLPIWVATEVMSFGVLNRLHGLMRQRDQEILAARFQIHTRDGKGDRGALENWLNNLRNVRNICAHHDRVWNRVFDVVIQAPGQVGKDTDDPLALLACKKTNNTLYGVLLITRHLLLSITPEGTEVVDLLDYIEEQSSKIGFEMGQLGFPVDWRSNPIWDRTFALDRAPMVAASLLDCTECMSTVETQASLSVEKGAAQRKLLQSYLQYGAVIEIELGKTKFYPTFQFRDGRIIDALAEINKEFAASCTDSTRIEVARALLNWWQTPSPDLPQDAAGKDRSPLDLLNAVTEDEFVAVINEARARGSL